MSDNLSLYEKNQRVRTLNAILWIVLITATALGLLNVYYTDRNSAIGLFSLAIICAPLLWMNSKDRYALSAMLLSIIALMVIVLSLILGNGVRDFGILAYPIFIMGGVLFFGRRATPYFSLAAIASLTWIVFLQMHG